MKLRFIEEPLAWIGIHTWPALLTYRQARARGRNTLIAAVLVAGYLTWRTI